MIPEEFQGLENGLVTIHREERKDKLEKRKTGRRMEYQKIRKTRNL